MRKHPRLTRLTVLTGLLLLAMMALAIAWYARVRYQMNLILLSVGRIEAQAAELQADPALRALNPAWIETLQSSVSSLDQEIGALESLVRPVLPLTSVLGWVPSVGGDLEAASSLLAEIHHTVRAAHTLVDAAPSLTARLASQTQGAGHLGTGLLEWLRESRLEIASAEEALERAQEASSKLSDKRLTPKVLGLATRIDRYQATLAYSLRALAAVDDLLAADGQRRYLVLAQNNHEIRATGGFISGVGLVVVEGGKLVESRFFDSYAIDNLAQPHDLPPPGLRRHMGAELLFLRDANWWPDFPTSARAAAAIFERDQGVRPDGVIAADLVAIQLLVQAAGAVSIPGYPQAVTADTISAQLMSYWESPRSAAPGHESEDWWRSRKDFAGDLLASLLAETLGQAPPNQVVRTIQAVGDALRTEHLLIYSEDPEVASVLQKVGWDGALRRVEGDFLMVVDSNVGFNKVNPNIVESVDYHLTFDAGGEATALLTIAYRHSVDRPAPACVRTSEYGETYSDLMERCYWDYVRVYLPLGTQVLDLKGGDSVAEQYDEDGYRVIATSLVLAPGQARQIEISYRPQLADRAGRYRLLVQNQPAAAKVKLRVTISPPPGTVPVSASGLDLVWIGDRALWQGDLLQDVELGLDWR